jgi:NADH:ubiquinone oxidoreductase subunit F (NADH-binding)
MPEASETAVTEHRYVIPGRVLPDKPIESLEEYLAQGGGDALQIALAIPPEETIDMVKRSGLRGRGGAGFPTGIKWASLRSDPATIKYLCCNGAEGEPATFKDRMLMRRNPYQLLEGVAIAAYASGAKGSFVALKRRFHTEVKALERARLEMMEYGLLGPVPLELRYGPDSYLFGEERGLLEVIEGRDPLPRIHPPYMQGILADPEHPYPAAVNNVETLSSVPGILRFGPDWFREVGTERSPGTMIFTLVGDVQRPGIYELPLGVTMNQLLYDIGGGPLPGHEFKVVVPGASNPVMIPAHFGTPLDFDATAAIGTGLGSASYTVYDDRTCMVRVAKVFSRFLHIESCGQCVPCKIQSDRITRLLNKIDDGEGEQRDLEEILAACRRVTDGQRCYLSTAESVLIQSLVRIFVGEFAAHLEMGGCPLPGVTDLPKLVDFHEDTGVFDFDLRYPLKRSDWTYEDDPVPGGSVLVPGVETAEEEAAGTTSG